jgi:hypothetical protein
MLFGDAFPIVTFLAMLALLHLSLNVGVGQGSLQTKVKTIFVLTIAFAIFCAFESSFFIESRNVYKDKGKYNKIGGGIRSIYKVDALQSALEHIYIFRHYYESGYIKVIESADAFAELYVHMLIDRGNKEGEGEGEGKGGAGEGEGEGKGAGEGEGKGEGEGEGEGKGEGEIGVALERLVDLRRDVLNTLHQFELNIPLEKTGALRRMIERVVNVTWRCVKIIRLKTNQLGTMFPLGYVEGVQMMYQ